MSGEKPVVRLSISQKRYVNHHQNHQRFWLAQQMDPKAGEACQRGD